MRGNPGGGLSTLMYESGKTVFAMLHPLARLFCLATAWRAPGTAADAAPTTSLASHAPVRFIPEPHKAPAREILPTASLMPIFPVSTPHDNVACPTARAHAWRRAPRRREACHVCTHPISIGLFTLFLPTHETFDHPKALSMQSHARKSRGVNRRT